MDLGTLKRIPPRNVWPDEARNFTPWLAENIEQLGETIGMELELVGREIAVGDFSADLLATDLGSGDLVVIENEYGKSDHDHLGKNITYATGRDARAVVWLCESFREEHRQALEWLNQRTNEDTLFFAVRIEVLQIDSSSPAVNFRPVVFPNEWQKSGSRMAARASSPRQEAYRRFFQGLIDTLREDHQFTNARVGQPHSWYDFTSGVSGIRYAVSFARGGLYRVELYIDVGDDEENAKVFECLHSQKGAIERALGFELEWEPLEEKRACRIAVYHQGSITDDDETLEAVHIQAVHDLLAFKRVLGPLLEECRSLA